LQTKPVKPEGMSEKAWKKLHHLLAGYKVKYGPELVKRLNAKEEETA
jgi:hypothetical protein